jgi:hypothetical protein
MIKAWIIQGTWTHRGARITERYVVALPDSERAVGTLSRVLGPRRGLKMVVEGPLPEAAYYRLGLTPGIVLRIGHEARGK